MRLDDVYLEKLFTSWELLGQTIDLTYQVALEDNKTELLEHLEHYRTLHNQQKEILDNLSENDYTEAEIKDLVRMYGGLALLIKSDAEDLLAPKDTKILN